jgi:hypothetical protein
MLFLSLIQRAVSPVTFAHERSNDPGPRPVALDVRRAPARLVGKLPGSRSIFAQPPAA